MCKETRITEEARESFGRKSRKDTDGEQMRVSPASHCQLLCLDGHECPRHTQDPAGALPRQTFTLDLAKPSSRGFFWDC